MIYLDNSATTPLLPELAEAFCQEAQADFFNPSALYAPAARLEKRLRECREYFAAQFGARPEEIIFTSGATESNNMAIFGRLRALRSGRKYRFISTAMEHPSVYEPLRLLEKMGHELLLLPLDASGQLRPEDLAEAVNEETALVSLMQLNNEFGSRNNIPELAAIVKAKNPLAAFHCDGVQAFGKYPCDLRQVDFYSISAHKFNGPKGVGLLLMRRGAKNEGGFLGGGQEQGLRSGTLNAPGIFAMTRAAKAQQARGHALLRRCKESLLAALQDLDGVCVNGPSPEEGAAHILNLSFLGLRGEVLLHALEARDLFVSTGSACASHKKAEQERVLRAIGLDKPRRESAIRFSFGWGNSEAQMLQAAEIIREEVTKLRRVQRR